GPVGPVEPIAPGRPGWPAGPVGPADPSAPAGPVGPCGPVDPLVMKPFTHAGSRGISCRLQPSGRKKTWVLRTVYHSVPTISPICAGTPIEGSRSERIVAATSMSYGCLSNLSPFDLPAIYPARPPALRPRSRHRADSRRTRPTNVAVHAASANQKNARG